MKGSPDFFFELSPNGFRYGCGYYAADRDTMDSIDLTFAEVPNITAYSHYYFSRLFFYVFDTPLSEHIRKKSQR